MLRRVSASRSAALALAEARRWLCQPGSGVAGLMRWQALDDTRRALRDHPCLGAVNQAEPALRQLVVAGYRLIYRVNPDTGDEATAGNIRILQVFGPGRK